MNNKQLTATINKLASAEAGHKVEGVATAQHAAPETNKVHTTGADKAKLEKSLHAKPETLQQVYKFKKVSAEDVALPESAKKILQRFEINAQSSEYDHAVLSDDAKTLVVVNNGTVALKQLCGGEGALSRFAYKCFGWIPRMFGAANKAIIVNRYKELFNAPDVEEQGEPFKHILTALASSEYHTVTVFHKDEKTGEFTKDPAAVAIIDAYANLIDNHIRHAMKAKNLPDDEIEKEIKAKKEKYGSFEKYYAADKLIPLASSSDDLKDVMHQVVEGLYAAQGFDLFVVPSQMHPQTNMNSNDLNYLELDWHYIKQKPDGQWNITGDSKLLATHEFKTPEDKDLYLKGMKEINYSPKITLVRPVAKASEPVNVFLANLQQWSNMSQGSELRTDDPQNLKLIEMTEPVNASIIKKHNSSLA